MDTPIVVYPIVPYNPFKRCSRCRAWYPLTGFSRAPGCKDGHRNQCRKCVYAIIRLRTGAKKRPVPKRIGESKECLRCHEIKPLSEFHYDKYRPDKRFTYCKPCAIELVKPHSENWEKNNRDRRNHMVRERRKKNPEKFRDRVREYRANKKKTEVGPVPTLNDLIKKQGGMCANCKRKGKKVKWHMDHIIPISRGGSHTADNVQALCAFCNQSKNAKMPDEWAAYNGRLL